MWSLPSPNPEKPTPGTIELAQVQRRHCVGHLQRGRFFHFPCHPCRKLYACRSGIGVASTKAFTAQVTVLTLMALEHCRKKERYPKASTQQLAVEAECHPQQVADVLATEPLIRALGRVQDVAHFLYLGRGPSRSPGRCPRSSRDLHIHAEGYPAAEMKSTVPLP